MTQPDDAPTTIEDGTDISAEPDDLADLGSADTPATSDPDQMTDDGEMGGTGGENAGGAG